MGRWQDGKVGGLKKSKDGTKPLHNLVALSHSVIFKSVSRLSPDQQVGAAALSPPQGASPGISNYFYQAYSQAREKGYCRFDKRGD